MRRRLLRRVSLLALAAVVLPIAAGWWYLTGGATAIELRKAEDASFSWAPGHPVFILVIGSDERAGVEGRRGDALHVIGVNPRTRQATILNIPRDSWVDIPGHGQGRINEAYYFGGADLQAATVKRLTGIPIHYIATTTFDGLMRMVDELGGVDVDVPYPMNDVNSGAVFPQARVHMTGAQALAFSRNRHVPDGDINRTLNQGHLILSALANLRARGTSSADTLGYLAVLMRNTDLRGLSPTDVYRLGRLGLSVDASKVRNVTVPGRIGYAGTKSVVFVDPGPAFAIFRDMADDAVLQAT